MDACCCSIYNSGRRHVVVSRRRVIVNAEQRAQCVLFQACRSHNSIESCWRRRDVTGEVYDRGAGFEVKQILRRVGSAHAIARGGNGKLAKTFDYCEECRSFSAVETSLERLPGTAFIRVYAIAFLCCRRLQPSSALSIPYRLHGPFADHRTMRTCSTLSARNYQTGLCYLSQRVALGLIPFEFSGNIQRFQPSSDSF